MSDCRIYKDLIERLIADEIVDDDRAALQKHCEQCGECAELMDMHMYLHAAGRDIPEASRGELRKVREGVMARITRDSSVHSGEKSDSRFRDRGISSGRNFRRDASALWRRYPVAALAATLLVALGAAAAGRWSNPPAVFDEALLMKAVNKQAAREAGLDEYWDSPFSYSNVAVRSISGGEIDLSFDVNRHVDLRTPQSSPLAREVLLHAILEPSSLGSRFVAMELSPGISDGRLKDAMILTLHNDPSLPVRLSALAALTRYPYDAAIQEALLKTLSSDPEVQIRLLALEYLASREVGAETIRGAVGDGGDPADRAVLQQVSLRGVEF